MTVVGDGCSSKTSVRGSAGKHSRGRLYPYGRIHRSDPSTFTHLLRSEEMDELVEVKKKVKSRKSIKNI